MDGIFTTTQAAKYLGLNPWQLHYDVRKGKLRPDRVLGKRRQAGYLFRKSTLDGYRRELGKGGRRARPRGFRPEMLAVADVAGRLGVEKKVVEGCIRRGELRVDGRVSGVRYILESTLEEFRREKGNEQATGHTFHGR